MRTKTDVAPADWRIDDAPVQLRRWASHRDADTFPLPTKDGREVVIGAGGDVAIARESGKYAIRDLESKIGMRIDGARATLCLLEPGMEIGVGSFTLVVESRRFMELRAFVSRMLGLNAAAMEAVDRALRAIRTAALRRAPLVLCGDGDLTAVAHDLHRRTHGLDRPFIVCDPRRRRGDATVRSAPNLETGLAAVNAARGGTVCIWAKRRPRDFAALLAATRDPSARVQLVVCGEALSQCKPFEVAPVVIPSMSTRASELAHVIDEYERDAREMLGGAAALTDMDREWVATRSAAALSEVATATLRLVALRQAGSVNAAAELLGMSHTSLLRWLGRRKLFTSTAKRAAAGLATR
jgi:hypothetical protein